MSVNPTLPRQRDVDEIEKKKEQMQSQMKKNVDVKFAQQKSNYLEEEFKKHTTGLITREEFVKKHQNIDIIIEDREKQKQEKKNQQIQENVEKRKLHQLKQLNLLSFDDDVDYFQDAAKEKEKKVVVVSDKPKESKSGQDKAGNQDSDSGNDSSEKIVKKIKCLGKNPFIDTSFLPDKEREEEEKIKKEMLRKQYLEIKQEKLDQFIFVNVSYWDGFNIIKQVKFKQKTQIWDFANQCLKQLESQYFHLSKLNAEDVYVIIKGDIVTSRLTFFDIIILEMHTKRGEPYFNFKEVKKTIDGKSQTVLEDKDTIILIIEKHKFDKQKFVYQGITNN